MTTSNQPQQRKITQTVEPSPQKVSTEVPISEERFHIIKETIDKSSKPYSNIAALKKVKLPDVAKRECHKDTRVSNLLVMDSWLLHYISISKEYIKTRFPGQEFFYEEKVEIFVTLLVDLYSSICISYEE